LCKPRSSGGRRKKQVALLTKSGPTNAEAARGLGQQ
jgi:hypothetical protein